jgi:hypothetical protein
MPAGAKPPINLTVAACSSRPKSWTTTQAQDERQLIVAGGRRLGLRPLSESSGNIGTIVDILMMYRCKMMHRSPARACARNANDAGDMTAEMGAERRRPGDEGKVRTVVDHDEPAGGECEALPADAGDHLPAGSRRVSRPYFSRQPGCSIIACAARSGAATARLAHVDYSSERRCLGMNTKSYLQSRFGFTWRRAHGGWTLNV